MYFQCHLSLVKGVDSLFSLILKHEYRRVFYIVHAFVFCDCLLCTVSFLIGQSIRPCQLEIKCLHLITLFNVIYLVCESFRYQYRNREINELFWHILVFKKIRMGLNNKTGDPRLGIRSFHLIIWKCFVFYLYITRGNTFLHYFYSRLRYKIFQKCFILKDFE